MENPEEILHSLEEFSKLRPKDIPRELEEYLCFVAKTGDPVYQWATIKSLFKEKLVAVITEFYESCPSVEIPPCPNVDVFNYDSMKTFILEKLDTFAAAPFTVQRICELLTTPRKEYNRIDKYMRALEKNILVVSTTEPGVRHTTENGEGIVNGLESEHISDNTTSSEINVEEMDEVPVWSRITPEVVSYNAETTVSVEFPPEVNSEPCTVEANNGSIIESVITCRTTEEQPYVSIEPVASESCLRDENMQETDVTVTITAIPAAVQKRRDSIEPVVSNSETIDAVRKENSEIPTLPAANIEKDTSPVEETAAINISSTTNDEQAEPNIILVTPPSDDPPLVQIPIISEITPSPNEDVNETSNVLKEDVEVLQDNESTSEATAEILTTDSIIPSEDAVLDDNKKDVSVSVSSSDDVSSEISTDIELKICPIEPIDDESRSFDEDAVQAESSTDSVIPISSDLETEETRDKQYDGVSLLKDATFGLSSTTPVAMDIDIGEESCQEPPTCDDG